MDTNNHMDNKHPFQNAIIIGGSSGMGLEIAKELSKHNIDLIISSRSSDKLEKALSVIKGEKQNHVWSFKADIRNSQEVDELVAFSIQKLKRIDCLIYCAGVSIHGNFEDIGEEDFDEVTNTNFKGLFLSCNKIWPIMLKQRWGQILAITSASGLRAYASGSIYCASKFAANGLLEALALEGQENNIKVSVLCPGQVDTPIWPSNVPEIEKARNGMLKPHDIACLAWNMLSSDWNAHVKQVIVHPFTQQPYLRGKNRGPRKKVFSI